MGDMGDFWRDVKASRSAYKRERVADQAKFIEWLRSIAEGMSILPGGLRFVIRSPLGLETFDYWPTSGKWCEVRVQRYRQGERSLAARITELCKQGRKDHGTFKEDERAGVNRTLARRINADAHSHRSTDAPRKRRRIQRRRKASRRAAK